MTTLATDSRPPLSDLPWLVPFGIVVVVGTWFTNAGADRETNADHAAASVAVLCALVAVGSLFAALRWPIAGVIGNALAVLAYVATRSEDGPIYLTLAAAAFLVAARRPPASWLPVVGTSVVVVSAVKVLRDPSEFDLSGSLWSVLAFVGSVAAGGAVGSLVRSRRQVGSERAQRAATEEQLRMAQDLHDGVGHGLAVIAMHAGVGLHVLEQDPAAVRSALEAIRNTARESLDALRAELSQLTGEPAARRAHRGLADLGVLADRVRAAGLAVSVTGATATGGLPDEVDGTVYAVVQEALTNVLRHSAARAVSITLDRSPEALTITVSDDGHGGAVQDEGMGLRGMRERVHVLGGTVTAGPRPRGGFQVRAELPL
jgi:signal transduction histidine kinase